VGRRRSAVGTWGRALGALGTFAFGALGACPARAAVATDLLGTVPGRVVDLARSAGGDLVYATASAGLGRLVGGAPTPWTPGTAFGGELVAVHAEPAGDWLALNELGDLYRVSAADGSATLVYDDLFLISQPTDLLVDAAGDALIAGRTISSGTRAVMRVSNDGERWMYYTTDLSPLGLDAQPDTSRLALSGTAGELQELWDDAGIPRSADLGSGSAGSFADLDGDLAVGADGTRWWSAGDRVWRRDPNGAIALEIAAAGAVRAVELAPRSAGVGTSLYYSVDVGGQSELREHPVAVAPGPDHPASFGPVPSRGLFRLFHGSVNAFCLTSDANGDLVLGGDDFGADAEVRRVFLPELTTERLTTPAAGIDRRPEGLVLEPAGTLLIADRDGRVWRIDESGGSVALSTVWTENGDPIVTAKGLAVGKQGELWIAQRLDFDDGSVVALNPDGSVATLADTEDSRGVTVDPFGARLLSSTWISAGFNSEVGALDPLAADGSPPQVLPGFGTVNFSNGSNWGDGDVLVDAAGQVYTLSEDDFSVYRYRPQDAGKERLGSGYLNRPAGLAIAPSLPDANSSTGFSLFVTEWNRLWELPGVPPPAPRQLDTAAPPVGPLRGFSHPDWGPPIALAHDSLGRLHAVTEAGHLLRFDGTGLANLLAGPGDGLPGGWVSLDADGADRWLGLLDDGRVVRIDPAAAYAVEVLFANPGGAVGELTSGALLQGAGPPTFAALERAGAGETRSRLWRIEIGGPAQVVADTARGASVAVPGNAGAWLVLERGRPGERGGLLAVDATLERSGHLRGDDTPEGDWRFDQVRGGGLAVSSDGMLWVAEGGSGRLWQLDPQSDARDLMAGSYDAPGALHLGPGTPGIAGAAGASVFAVDGYAVYEHGVDADLIAGGPAPFPAEFTADARPTFNSFAELRIAAPEHANRAYLAFVGTSGKEPGFDLVLLGNPFETRTVPLNFDPLWSQTLGAPFSGFLGALDSQGQSPTPFGVDLPDDPFLASLGVFADLVWLPLDPLAPSAIADVGGTCQVYLGQP
jgi:sugar lactone lactonase YvrE